MVGAHDAAVWDIAWHPLGHLLCSGSSDHMIKFWGRNKPGDAITDKYNATGKQPRPHLHHHSCYANCSEVRTDHDYVRI